jgi:hypothetical protein
MMARHHAQLLASIWSDPDWLDLSPTAQRLYMLLLSQGRLSLIGHLDLMPHRWATLAHGTTVESITADLLELEGARFVAVDHDTQEVLIRTLVAHDVAPHRFNRNLAKGLWTSWGGILSPSLRLVAVENMPDFVWDKSGDATPAAALHMRTSPRLEPPVETTGDDEPLEPPVETTGSDQPSESPVQTVFSPSPSPSLVTGHRQPVVETTSSNAFSSARDDDDDRGTGSDQRRVETALRVLAERDLTERQEAPNLSPIGDVESWTRKAVEGRRERCWNRLLELAFRHPTFSPTDLANLLEPGPTASRAAATDPLADQAAAAQERAERNRRRANGQACPRCGDTGWATGRAGDAEPCDCPAAPNYQPWTTPGGPLLDQFAANVERNIDGIAEAREATVRHLSDQRKDPSK